MGGKHRADFQCLYASGQGRTKSEELSWIKTPELIESLPIGGETKLILRPSYVHIEPSTPDELIEHLGSGVFIELRQSLGGSLDCATS